MTKHNSRHTQSIGPRTPLVLLSAVAAIALFLAGCTAEVPQMTTERQIDITLVPHVAFGMAEQDAYVEPEPGADSVVRIMQDQVEEYANAQVYAAAEYVAHDPFGLSESPIGPFSKGVELGMTMEEWLAATGTGTYTVRGGEGTIDLTFDNLVEDGVYTLWCAYVSLPPNVYIADLPCGPIDGSANAFSADENGHAEFQLTAEKLPDSTETVMMAIAAAYHSDGETHGASPGTFGTTSHVQIFTMLPPPGAGAWRTGEIEAVAASN